MAFMEWLIHETSLHSLITVRSRDIWLILLSRFLRMVAWGAASLVLGIYLWITGNKGTEIGTFLTLTLLGDAVISYILTMTADKIGRRKVLFIGSLLMIVAGTTFAFSKNYYLLLWAAIVGVIAPGAHEVGPFRAVQESTLAQLTPLEARTDVYAWFAVTSTVGMACGLSLSGWLTYILRERFEYDWKDTYPFVFGLYAIIGLIKAILTLFLTERCEPDYVRGSEDNSNDRDATAPLLHGRSSRPNMPRKHSRVSATVRRIGKTVTVKMSPKSRSILIRLCILFAINSFASGMLPVTLMAWYANWRYRRWLAYRLGYAMAGVWLVASIANLFSASVARRIGLVRAMVFTHLPSAIILAFIPLAHNWLVFLVLLLVSSAFGSMDQAPRMAFVAAVFSPSERTAVIGTINLVKTVASAGGPLLTGYFHDKKMWSAVFVCSAILKVLYDIGLLAMFLKTKLPETESGPREFTVTDVDVGILLSENLSNPEEFERINGEEVDDDDDDDGNNNRDKTHYEHIEEV